MKPSTPPQEKEPIAIIGIGCRFPGYASSPEKFWNLLCQGIDAIIEVPEDRWDLRRFYDAHLNTPGKMIAKRGGFLKEKWDAFDAEFFHISPREAKYLDPQQRLLLEIAWEAMEDGGLVPERLRGTNGGVFIGAFTTDWQTLQNSPYNRHHCEMYSGINGSKTILSARLAHFFDLKGPCLSIDTACSSSLVAVHLACQSLWLNECSLAFAGGVNAMLVPETSIAMSKGRFLNPAGQCRSFDAEAKGYVRGEGGGIVILKLLSKALKDQDPIYAVIKGTGVNQDGYTQGGITQPNSESQRILMLKVLEESQVSPHDIHYVEAHGTGTPAGDPAEALAINQVLNQKNERKALCFLGSVKSNIGHLEAAAGIAGLIKAALCLKLRKIPPNLHFETPNPNIPFATYSLRVPTAIEEFVGRYAFVNAFGYGGTNANALLQSYEPLEVGEESSVSSGALLLPFSGKNLEDLKGVAETYAHFLQENPKVALEDIAHTTTYRRSVFDYRFSVSAHSLPELQNKLQLIGKGEIPEGCAKGKLIVKNCPLAFVYTGMGPQWWGMGRDLLEHSPFFLKIIEECDRIVLPLAGWSLLEELKKSEMHSRMDQPEISQIANFSIQAALTALLKTWGIAPNFIIGHSIGEVAAAYAAGILSLEEGLTVSYHRSRLQAKRKDLGTMLATGLSLADAQSLLVSYHNRLSIAAVNSRNSVTLSGDKLGLDEIAELLEKKGIYHRFLKVNIAYHSHQMEGLEDEVLAALESLSPKTPSIPFYSTVYGDACTHGLNNAYWWQNIRQPVLFASAVSKIIEKGCPLFLEIGPHPVLGTYIKDALQESHVQGEILATLNRKKVDTISLQECLGGLYVNGYALPWDRINPKKGSLIRMPTYPWRRSSHWVESEESHQYRLGLRKHPMLSRKIGVPAPTWQVEINQHYFPWIEDHQIEGTRVFPAAGYVEAALEAHAADLGKTSCCFEEIFFHQLLTIQENKEPLLQVSLDAGNQSFKVHSLPESHEKEWICHASGRYLAATHTPPEAIKLSELKLGEIIEKQEIYQTFADKGLEYGPDFQKIKRLWKREGEALAEMEKGKTEEPYLLHPSLLDAAFQTLIGTFEESISSDGVILPSQIERLIYHETPKGVTYCQARSTKQTSQQIVGDLVICDEAGNICVEIRGLVCRIISQNVTRLAEKLYYHPVWVESSLSMQHPSNTHTWLIGSDLNPLSERLQAAGQTCLPFSLNLLDTEEGAIKLVSLVSKEEQLSIVLGYMSTIQLENLTSAEIQAAVGCLNLVKALAKLRGDKPTKLWIMTTGLNLFGASLRGLGRVIRQECGHIECSFLEIETDHQSMDSLSQELLHSWEDEIALRQGKRYAYKVEKIDTDSIKKVPLSAPSQAFALELKTPGVIESLYYKQIAMPSPLPGEVGIQVHASSLNFKDLMKILGMLNQNALEGTYFGTSFGMECAGTIVSVGKGVKKYQIGDQVCAFMPNTFQSYIALPARYTYPIPPGCSLDDASIYVPFITVLRALKDIGNLKRGETILIHSATGAVGLAAVQYARFVGARIFATAGSKEKRDYLRQLGVEGCADSRSLSFADDVMTWTKGKGVDVILNSLGGEVLVKSWSVLAPYGRFLEIGKKDISVNSKLPMKDFDRNTLFASLDLDRIFKDQPQLIQRLLKETFALFRKGIFTPLPCKIFPANESSEAFQFMARSKQVGKIMLKFADQSVEGVPVSQQRSLDPMASYVITGGLSGFGLLSAQWLVEKGAKHLILIGRSGASSKEAQKILQQWESKGVKVNVGAVDVSNYSELSDFFADCGKEMPPIKGVLHSAMVLKDAFLSQQTEESMHQVMSPKIGGCINLHRLTATMKLDFFVLYSSISSLIGNPGQGNYAAANAFLDAFCHYRKSLGLAATTMNWGALKTGVLLRNAKVAEHLANHGIKAIPAKIALSVLERTILEGYREDNPQFCVLDLDWKKLLEAMPAMRESYAFADFRSDNQELSGSSLLEELRALEPEKRVASLVMLVKEMVGKTLKMEPGKIDSAVRLNTLGIDSLMTMELQASVEQHLGIKIPTMELMKGPTIEQLAHFILKS